MFRYIAFSWATTDPAQVELAQCLNDALKSHGEWQPAFSMPGQQVYVTGAVCGANDVHVLPVNQGVILGRLFRRSAPPGGVGDRFELHESEAQRIVHTDGQALVDNFWGRYVAFLPSWTGESRVLRDPTGALPCFRTAVQGVSVVLSWLEDLRTLLGMPMPPVNWEAIAALLTFGRLEGRETALVGVTQILPGELTPVSTRGMASKTLWTAADFARRASSHTAEEAARLLRGSVIDSAHAWASCYESFLLRVSGGLDSAILLGSLTSGTQRRSITCLNYFAEASDSDERTYARLAADRAQAELKERPLDTGFELDRVLDVALTPIPANYIGGMATDKPDAEAAAAHGAGAIFTGAGGDQLFFEFRRTWPAADYLKQQGVGIGFLEAALDAAHLGRVSFWRALRLAFRDQSFRGRAEDGASRSSALMCHDVQQSAAKTAERFAHPVLLGAGDLPIGKFHHLGMLICPFEFYNHYMRAAAPEMVHPLMSQPVLEQCLATPTYVLTKGGRGRALARQAFADLLPPEIASRRSKGGMDMHVSAVLQRSLPFARELLLDGQLAKQGMLDLKRLEVALSGRPSATAAYVSEIHACIAIEAWVRSVTAPVP